MTILRDIPLHTMTTFKTGGRADFFCCAESEDDIREAVFFAKDKRIPFFVLGGGSNVLVDDRGYRGIVIQMAGSSMHFLERENDIVRAESKGGVVWDALVSESVSRGLYGLENLSGIPGSVGAAPIQNIGAYGSEVSDTVDRVRVYDTDLDQFKTLMNAECHFFYRNSIFKEEVGKHLIVVGVAFNLFRKGTANVSYKDLIEYFGKEKERTLSSVRNAILSIRARKFPDLSRYGTAGSFFKNPLISRRKAEELRRLYPEIPLFLERNGCVKIPIAWVLDHVLRVKGFKEGDVGFYENHALVLVNYGNATTSELRSFANRIAQCVHERMGINLESEVQFVNAT